MRTNEEHVRLAKRVFTKGMTDTIDIKMMVLRILSMTEGKGPLTKDELSVEVVAQWDNSSNHSAVLAVLDQHLNSLIEHGLVEKLPQPHGVEVYYHTKYFEELIYWQKVKAGLIERPAK